MHMHWASHVRPGLISDWKSQQGMRFQSGWQPALLGSAITRVAGSKPKNLQEKDMKKDIGTEALVATNGVSPSSEALRLAPTPRVIVLGTVICPTTSHNHHFHAARNDAAQCSGRVGPDRCSLGWAARAGRLRRVDTR